MAIVTTVAETLQRVLGAPLDRLGHDTGVIRRHRKFSGATLLQTLALTLLKSPCPKPEDYAATAALLGVPVTPQALSKRFTPALVDFLRQALELLLQEVIAAAPAVVPLLDRFTAVFVGDGSTVPLPDEWADEFPGCGGKSGSGKAALKLQVVWELRRGRLAELLLEPGRGHDTHSAALDAVPPAGSLTVRDLGYFDLKRLRAWAAAGAFWISRFKPATAVFDPDGRPLDLRGLLRRQPAGAALDIPVLLGAEERLGCRLIALRAPQEAAARRRQKAYEKAQKHGQVPTAEYLAWCDWTVFVTDCGPELLTWKEVVVLYRVRWQVELLFKLWKSHNGLASGRADRPPERRMAELWGKLIAVVLQHWLLVATAWSDARRSLWKASGVIRDRVALLAEALGDPTRLEGVLVGMAEAIARVARVSGRKAHPSSFQLLNNPELLDWAT